MASPLSPRQKLARLKRAEASLNAICDGHPDTCGCELCDAMMAVWKARIDIEKPAWRDLVVLVDRLPLDGAPSQAEASHA